MVALSLLKKYQAVTAGAKSNKHHVSLSADFGIYSKFLLYTFLLSLFCLVHYIYFVSYSFLTIFSFPCIFFYFLHSNFCSLLSPSPFLSLSIFFFLSLFNFLNIFSLSLFFSFSFLPFFKFISFSALFSTPFFILKNSFSIFSTLSSYYYYCVSGNCCIYKYEEHPECTNIQK